MNPLRKITVESATLDFPMCPTILSGKTKDGSTVYVRYRWGRLSIRVETRNPPPNGGSQGYKILEKKLDPKGLAGSITFDEIREHTAELLEWPAELTPKTYDESDVIDL